MATLAGIGANFPLWLSAFRDIVGIAKVGALFNEPF